MSGQHTRPNVPGLRAPRHRRRLHGRHPAYLGSLCTKRPPHQDHKKSDKHGADSLPHLGESIGKGSFPGASRCRRLF